jgi:hypothetical protein
VATIQYGIVSDDAKRLPESVQQQVLVSAGLSPALRERVQGAVAKYFFSGAPDGPRSLTATAWAVRGRN